MVLSQHTAAAGPDDSAPPFRGVQSVRPLPWERAEGSVTLTRPAGSAVVSRDQRPPMPPRLRQRTLLALPPRPALVRRSAKTGCPPRARTFGRARREGSWPYGRATLPPTPLAPRCPDGWWVRPGGRIWVGQPKNQRRQTCLLSSGKRLHPGRLQIDPNPAPARSARALWSPTSNRCVITASGVA